MESRLIPVNAILALIARDGGWFEDLADQGFRLHALELDVQSTPGVVRADVVVYRLDPDLILLIEGKSGRNVEERQARGYDAAEVAGIRARADLPNELVGRTPVAVSPLYVCLQEHREDIVGSLAALELDAPVLSVSSGTAFLDGPVPAGLERFAWDDARLGLPPVRIRLDRESPLEEFMAVLIQRIVAAAVRGETHLEAHAPEGSSEGVAVLVGALAERSGFKAEPVGDELWWLTGGGMVGCLDTLNPRFWQLHSTSSADEVARVVRAVVAGDARLDTAWLPKTLLGELDGEHLWVKSAFEADELLGSEVSARRWRARFEGVAPEGLLDLLRDTEYERAASLTGLGSLVCEPEIGDAVVVADFQGAFVTGQGDFSVAASAVWNMVRRYEQWVRALEDRHRMSSRALEGSGVTLEGDVATISFGRDVEDLDRLVEGLFTAKEPFRLWGVPERTDGGWFADVVDLHVGHPLRMDILTDRVRILLEPETCGNTLARLVTNLQQRLDARTALQPVAA